MKKIECSFSWTGETGNFSNDWADFLDALRCDEWNKLSDKEKSIMRAYRNHLYKNSNPIDLFQLMSEVDDIHQKYPDFHIGLIP